MNRLPTQEERNNLTWNLSDAELRKATARDFMRLVEMVDGAHVTPNFPMTFDVLEDPRSTEDFRMITPYGDIIGRFDFVFLTVNNDNHLYGRYKFFFSQADEGDKPVSKLICSLCLHSNHVRLGAENDSYGVARDIDQRLILLFFPWLIVNVIDLFDVTVINRT